ncbi:GntR family transcriptional regulator [Jatrophihabitans sp.]|uniref:GntR family transcriptional regulator n=1 Tax=Jatrophihabitans sp. TaxID=1932789 RepID=UPI0030C673F1|nr:GntR family transcriptional regulator [Jatrophihabitans sp.]
MFSLDPDSPVPPFEQVRAQLAAAIDTGALSPASRIPTVRKLAADLGLAVNTVARAYRELELAGLIETRGRNGTYVAGSNSPSRAAAARAARDFVRRMRDLGIGEAESLAIVRREIETTLHAAQL